MRYAPQIWGQNCKVVMSDIEIIQNKALRIINFKDFREHANPLYKNDRILKFSDQILFNNCLFIFDELSGKLPSVFAGMFVLTMEIHAHNTRGSLNKLLDVPLVKTSQYGSNSLTYQSICQWNILQNKLDFDFAQPQMNRSKFKRILKEYLFSKYL